MWQSLQLSGLGVIDSAELELDTGFTVITGETGAGKTMIVTALGLLRGERADLGLVRHGTERARVEASVTVPENSPVARIVTEAGGELDDQVVILGRILSSQGRSRAVVGGASVPAAVLSEITDELVAVHGQSDQHRLLRPEAQRAAIDQLAGDAVAELLGDYVPAYERWRAVESELNMLRNEGQQRAQELDLLRHGIEEISAVEPILGEDEQLRNEQGRLAHAEGLARAAELAHAILSEDPDGGDARSLVANASAMLGEVAGHDEQLDELAKRVGEIAIMIDDVGPELVAYGTGIELDPARLEQVQERLAALASLQRRYGPELSDVLHWQACGLERLSSLDHDDEQIVDLEHERVELLARLDELAGRLSELRRDCAVQLGERVEAELAELAMPSAKLSVSIEPAAELGPYGRDVVELLFAANTGSQPRPLGKSASGGELSRLMLALEVVLADREAIETLVFDEVDAGIGGRAAVEVGRRLARLSQNAQVLAVTHLAQVAAFADHHFHIAKDDDGQVTTSSVRRLPAGERVDELARMLAGMDDSAAAQQHARELLDLAER